jgi:osmotically-inducible protein OsmY
MSRHSNTGRTRHSNDNGEHGGRSESGGAGRGAAHRGTSRGARHLNDDSDTGDARDEDSEFGHDQNFEGRGHDEQQFGDVRQGDSSGFGRPLSFQGKGFFGGGVPFEQSAPHIGAGNAVGYGPGRQPSGQPSGGGFRGKGPKGYQRSDERLTEEINDRLTYDDDIDASEISVAVAGGEATLSGTVNARSEKRRAEDLSDDVPGITHMQNNLRVKQAPK